MQCELVRSPAPRRPLCWFCAKLEIRDILVAKRARVSYLCNLHRRSPNVDRCAFYLREPGTDDDLQRRGRWRVVGCAS
jgi:hypothetical protein